MSNTKSTKRALLYSIMAMLICVAMLIGTTFAWFTDSVTSRGNIIKSGNLKISATYQDASAAGTISYTVPGFTRTADNTIKFSADTTDINESNKIIEEDLWEPGAVGAKLITVHNDGNLAAKIKLNFTVYDGGLQNALWYDFIMVNGNQVVGNFTKREMSTLSAFAGAVELPLMPKDEDGDSVSFILIYGMKEEAGNEYQGKSFSADVTIFATQDTYETDSFDNQYDVNAKYEVAKFAFANATEEIAFCPECYNAKTTANHATHEQYLKIANGVAKVERTGAWLDFANLDWDNNTYFLEYDIDLSELVDGAFVAFDSGETKSWQDLQLGFKRAGDVITAYNTLSVNSLNDTTKLGTIGNNVHAVYTYSVNASNALDMKMVISDGANTYTVAKTVNNFNKNATICWDVYTTDSGSGTYAKLDNFVFSSLSK